jgi:hypothetical protein
MQYMFLVYASKAPRGPSAEHVEYLIRTHEALIADARRKGVLRRCDSLKSTETATTIRVQDGKTIMVDGPFAETKERLVGYYVLECRHLDEAIEWARRIPTSDHDGGGSVEIRPVDDRPAFLP